MTRSAARESVASVDSPLGWDEAGETAGNNVRAGLDRDGAFDLEGPTAVDWATHVEQAGRLEATLHGCPDGVVHEGVLDPVETSQHGAAA